IPSELTFSGATRNEVINSNLGVGISLVPPQLAQIATTPTHLATFSSIMVGMWITIDGTQLGSTRWVLGKFRLSGGSTGANGSTGMDWGFHFLTTGELS